MQTIMTTALNTASTSPKTTNSVVPDCHGLTQKGSRLSSVTSPSTNNQDDQQIQVWRHGTMRGQCQDVRFAVICHTSSRPGVTPRLPHSAQSAGTV